MRLRWKTALAACAAAAMAWVGGGGAASAQQAPQELTVIVYGGSFEEGWKRAVIEPFERANPGIRVRIATGLTMQTAALMRAQRDDVRVDVVMMDEVGAAQANAENLFDPLSAAAIPNIEALYPQFRVPGDPYTKFMYVSQVIAYDRGRIRTPPASFRDLWRPEYRNRVAIPGIDTSHGVMLLLMTARMDGGGERNIEPGFASLRRLAPSVVTFWNQHAQVSQMFTQGDIWITTWTSDRAQGLIDQGGNIGWVIPQEGGYIIDSTIGIARGTRRLDAARRYVNFVLGEEAQAANARHTYLVPVNRNVRLPEEVARKLPAGEETLRRLVGADWNYVNTQRPQWTDRWNREVATGGR
jgi:putative spermidine/putrescine transport system substrate-binding protein